MLKTRKFYIALAISSAIALAICCAALLIILMDAKKSESFDLEISNQYTAEAAPAPKQLPRATEPPVSDEKEIPEESPTVSLEVDFEALRALNSDTVGWIYQEGTKINYPVVQTTDNDSYLNKRFDGESTERGCIFADYRTDATASNALILYGHNVSRTTLLQFSSLVFYLEKPEYVREHPSFEFYDAATGEGKVYDVFAVIKADVSTKDSAARYYRDVPDEEYADYLEFLKAQSAVDTGITPTTDSRVILLSTCITRQYNVRCLIACVERPVEETPVTETHDIMPLYEQDTVTP